MCYKLTIKDNLFNLFVRHTKGIVMELHADQILNHMEKLLNSCQQLDSLLKKNRQEQSGKKKKALLPEINTVLIEFYEIQSQLSDMNMMSISEYMESQPESTQQRFQELTENLQMICESCQIRIENSEGVSGESQKIVDDVIFRIMEESKQEKS